MVDVLTDGWHIFRVEAVAFHRSFPEIWLPMPNDILPFREFDKEGDVRIYHNGLLPHWRQPHCTYFVTFRFADSVPRQVVEEAKEDLHRWLKAHDINPFIDGWQDQLSRLRPDQQRAYANLSDERVNISLDECLGKCWLRDRALRNLVANAIRHFHGQRVLAGEFVIMPNHVHALLRPLPGFELEDLLHSIKSYTALQINRAIGQTGALWQRESHDHIVRDGDELQAYQDYIAGNAMKAGLPESDYLHIRATYRLEE